MEINKIRHFRTVVETGHLGKAAGILGISAGALSKSLKSFSEEIGKELIRPLGRGICVTDEGRSVYHKSHQLIRHYDHFLGSSAGGAGKSETRIGTFEVFSGAFLCEFLRQEAPEERLQILELGPSRIEDAVLAHEIDYGITYAPFPSPKLDHLKIRSFRMKVYALHPEKWAAIPVGDWPFAVPTTKLGPNPFNMDGLDHWPDPSCRRNVKYKFELLQTALEATSRGLSVIHCPEFVANFFNGTRPANLRIKELSFSKGRKFARAAPLAVFLVKRNNEGESALFKKLAKFVRLTV